MKEINLKKKKILLHDFFPFQHNMSFNWHTTVAKRYVSIKTDYKTHTPRITNVRLTLT